MLPHAYCHFFISLLLLSAPASAGRARKQLFGSPPRHATVLLGAAGDQDGDEVALALFSRADADSSSSISAAELMHAYGSSGFASALEMPLTYAAFSKGIGIGVANDPKTPAEVEENGVLMFATWLRRNPGAAR